MNPEEKETNKAEKSRYLGGTYRGAVFRSDTDQDCMVKMLNAHLHGEVVYSGTWNDMTDDFNFTGVEKEIDRILENERNVYANKYDFQCSKFFLKNCPDIWILRPEQNKLGYFVIDDVLVYAAASLASDGKSFIYGEISEEEFELLSNSYENCTCQEMIEVVNQEVIKKSRLFYLMGDCQDGSREKITKKDLYSLNAKFYQHKDTGVILYAMNDKYYEWHDHDNKWVSIPLPLHNIENPNNVPISWEDAWKRINEFNTFSKTLEVKKVEAEKKAKEQTKKETKEKAPTEEYKTKKTIKSDPSIHPFTKVYGLGNHANGLFKAAFIMNYAVAAIVLLIAIILLFTGNFLDAAGLIAVSAIYAGLTFWFQKTRKDLPAFLLLFGIGLIDFGGVCALTATGIALFMVMGLSYNLVLGFPARLFAFIISRHYNSKIIAELVERQEREEEAEQERKRREEQEREEREYTYGLYNHYPGPYSQEFISTSSPQAEKPDKKPDEIYYFCHYQTKKIYKSKNGTLYFWDKSTNEWTDSHNFTYEEAISDSFKFFKISELDAWIMAGGEGDISEAFRQDPEVTIQNRKKREKEEKELQEKLEQYEYTHAYGGKYSPNQKY